MAGKLTAKYRMRIVGPKSPVYDIWGVPFWMGTWGDAYVALAENKEHYSYCNTAKIELISVIEMKRESDH